MSSKRALHLYSSRRHDCDRKTLAILLTASLAIQALLPASAQETGPYASLGATYAGTSIDDESYSLGATDARIGYAFHRYFAIEVEGIFGLIDDSFVVTNVPTPFEVMIDLDYSVAGYGVARLPLSENTNFVARVGYHNTKLTLSSVGGFESGSYDNIAFGAGVEYFWGKSGLRGGYRRIVSGDDDFNFNLISLSFVRRF